jgi:hypothetical protein
MQPKPDGAHRFCQKDSNEMSRFDTNSMPHVKELMYHLGKTCFKTTLDLTEEIIVNVSLCDA